MKTPGDYLAFVGRVSPEKGVDTAIRVAEAAGLPLRIGAKVDRVDQDYFDAIIRPMLRSLLIDFLGEVDDDTKAELLSHARALLLPLDWPEPFGLVMIEAMACVTPVVARPCNAAPEVVADGITGFLRRDFRELVEAVVSVGALDRHACRLHVERNFSVGLMLDRYERLYRTVIRVEPGHLSPRSVRNRVGAFTTRRGDPRGSHVTR